MDIRTIEKSKKTGYMFYITYDGTKFQAFDEMKDKTTVKGTFRNIMEELGFSWAKGIQQAGRTDAKVSANENILYVSSNFMGNIEKIKDRFNENSANMKITMVKKTFPNLAFPELIAGREYIYRYPQKKIKRTEEEIVKICEDLSGKYDVSEFTDKKGLELKEHIREVEISYKNGKLFFAGDSFMPKQVRIMSGYILTGEKVPLEGKYLTLNKIKLSTELQNMIFEDMDSVDIQGVERVEKTSDGALYIFYVEKSKKGEVIGKNGKNIKALKKIYGNIVVREL
ncbi:tRNA pseudouridine synthase A [Fusobacterium sp. DD29]|uniref:KH domain-containing protein n=1 Tax=unclassified Fusobacterium TaxID=2648384 RepID=UPI001B8BAB6A|nr:MULTISPECIES: KH domain-containing protein [unclassified Fusobacterium]MBR8700211.1 tRNA pseudouridine synthase A [Fusobacterium sp. DD45]MBR8710338.1 tRNA pseudouridine synthase A [Fusobacterium sp. DD28]MBR8748800.1 tRNA pseudouridine synthase A [Fusobacterium sp. DD29]MBR8750933.1 tRNA pseudouridine synthase A [Fusobacterium sp. DD26]MBR8761043.1 tRNA pseudouridine synthase A [Fusobacterium sp. DD25]